MRVHASHRLPFVVKGLYESIERAKAKGAWLGPKRSSHSDPLP